MKNNEGGGKTPKALKITIGIILTLALAAGAVYLSFVIGNMRYSDSVRRSVSETDREDSIYYNALDTNGKYMYNAIVKSAGDLSDETETMSFDLDITDFEKRLAQL